MILAYIALPLLSFTGMKAHIAISVAATVALIVFTVLGKKDWKVPALEIADRILFLITMVTGIVMIALKTGGAISIVHKVSFVLFALLLIINFVLNSKNKD